MKHTLLYCQKTLKDYITAAYFFNARGNELEKTPLGMFRSLLYQLLDQDHLLCERFIPIFLGKQKKHENEWEWKIGELENFLLFHMEKFQPKPLLLLIDALDECDELEVRQVVSFLELLSINAVSAKIPLNICLSSRHYPNIGMKKTLELIVEERREHDQDIFKYVQHKLRIKNREIEEELLRKAAHVFMWVILVVEMLNHAYDNGKVRAMQKKLREVPSDLDEVFWTLLDKDNLDKQETILLLQWVLFAQRLLKPEELFFAVLAGTGAEELGAWNRLNDTPEMIKRFITSTSRGLIEIRKGDTETVQFIHESVNDFLLRNKRLQRLDPTLEQQAIGASHDRLMACCMSYIMMKELEPLAKNISYTEELYFDEEYLYFNEEELDFKKKELDFNYPFLEYTSSYVLNHAEKAQAECYLQQALIRWLQQPHGEFDRLRTFHNVFTKYNISKCSRDADLIYSVSLQGHCKLLQLVLLEKGAKVNAKGGKFGTALQAASYAGHDIIVQQLLEKGADINAQGGKYGNALQAASYGGHDQIVQRLLEKDADVNAQGGWYGNALQAASYRGHDQIVQQLLEEGADVNAQGRKYGNALQAASYEGRDQTIQRLLEGGADINA
jgi:Ankyrin repeats (3 copies)/Ankyrin repeat